MEVKKLEWKKLIGDLLIIAGIAFAFCLWHCWDGYLRSWMRGHKGMVNCWGVIIDGVFFIDLFLALLIIDFIALMIILETY